MNSTTGSDSPFEGVLGDRLGELPEPFRIQFLVGPDSGYVAVLEGTMESIWVRPRWLFPLFRVLGLLKLLPRQTGRDVAVTLHITGERTRDGRSQQVWRRRFGFARPDRMTTVSEYDAERDAVVDLLGPLRAFEITWDVKFAPPDSLTLTGIGWRLRLGRFAIPLPSKLIGTPVVHHEVVPQSGDVRISFANSVPLLGKVFGYEGTFRARREPIA